MIKVKLYELEKHRNETTFRPYLMAQNVLRDVGIEFTQGDSYDYAWVGQASVINKTVSLEQSTEQGLEFLQKISGDSMILDGQDSTSLIGTYDVFKESNALLLMKNAMLKDRDLYKQSWVNGRQYWGKGDYRCEDFDKYKDRIVLSGTNWLSTVQPQWKPPIDKPYDVSALFGYPLKDSSEYLVNTSKNYDKHRKLCIDVLKGLPYDIKQIINGQKLPPEKYYLTMAQCKILLSPLGFGEYGAPRDVEATMFGSIIIKPDISFVDTNPNWYEPNKTYIPCKLDYSDLPEKISYVLDNFTELQQTMIPYARKKFDELYTFENIAISTYNIFNNLSSTITE